VERDYEAEIMSQVAHLRWANSQGYNVPIFDEEEIVDTRAVMYGIKLKDDEEHEIIEQNERAKKIEQEPLRKIHNSYYYGK
jgi:hypothetical protein